MRTRVLICGDDGERVKALLALFAALPGLPGAGARKWIPDPCLSVTNASKRLDGAGILVVDHAEALAVIDALEPSPDLPVIAVLRPGELDAEELLARSDEFLPDLEATPHLLERTLRLCTPDAPLPTDVEYLAQRDLLTGLPNRRLFERQLELALLGAQRHDRRIAVGWIRIDAFESLATQLAQNGMEQLIVTTGRRLEERLRRSDLIARASGGNFLLMLELAGEARDLAYTADKLLEAVSTPAAIGDARIEARASLGLAMFPQSGRTASALIREAHAAVEEIAAAGGNDFRFVNAELDLVSRRQLQIEDALPRAIERGELSVTYQPRLDLSRMKIAGAEVLARWHSPEFGEVSPNRFIPVAEASGAIGRVGAWVLHTAMTDLGGWLRNGHSAHLGVNVSAGQFSSGDFAERVRSELAACGVPPAALELEITERMFVDNVTEHLALFDELTELGIGFAVDDFGIGYSSLAYLKHFPVHALKIDRAFVAPLPDSHEDAAIVRAIIALGHALGLRVVAEGVETPDQLEFLRSAGCDEAQGYLIGRGATADAFERMLEGSAGTDSLDFQTAT